VYSTLGAGLFSMYLVFNVFNIGIKENEIFDVYHLRGI
jgi:hypothetical protein